MSILSFVAGPGDDVLFAALGRPEGTEPLPVEYTGAGRFAGILPTTPYDVTVNLPIICPGDTDPQTYAQLGIEHCRGQTRRPFPFDRILGERDPESYSRCLSNWQSACTGPEIMPSPTIQDTCGGIYGTTRCTVGGVASDILEGTRRIGELVTNPIAIGAVVVIGVLIALRR